MKGLVAKKHISRDVKKNGDEKRSKQVSG